jgi:hypothetical protein
LEKTNQHWFVLVDNEPKKLLYKQSGATEYAAQQSAEGKVQESGIDLLYQFRII